MKDSYDPINPEEEYLFRQDYLDERNDGIFTTGPSGDDIPCSTCYCKRCGGNTFYVGKGDWFTSVKCVTCNYEICVHEG